MAKNLENLSERDLLIEIAKGQRKEAKSGRISATAMVCLVIAFIIALSVFVPLAANTLEKVNTTLTEAENVAVSAQKSLEEIDEMVSNFDGVIVDNTDSVNSALSKVNEIDIKSLNKSIEELASILDPLARLFGHKS